MAAGLRKAVSPSIRCQSPLSSEIEFVNERKRLQLAEHVGVPPFAR
jgi:hypothetical protein